MHEDIRGLIDAFAKLPGVGRRSAERVALHVLTQKERALEPLLSALARASQSVTPCRLCGNPDAVNPCGICAAPRRAESGQICVVERVSDLWAIERSGFYSGRYFVLGGTLSAAEGNSPEDLGVPALLQRVRDEHITEVIIATGATLDGQTTALYLADALAANTLTGAPVTVTRPAQGMPVGGEMNYLDEGTLAAALQRRQAM